MDDMTVTTVTGVMAKRKQTVPAAVCLGIEHEGYGAVIEIQPIWQPWELFNITIRMVVSLYVALMNTVFAFS